ncbi:hypothetical protein ASPACDRAFT_44693 [Aspergillus aculeatus ATCC 16872]|uniref:DUF2241 domain-containing protein n=1 Tax=Aspergillus aculeatus (strain ATCC 16872 / CBS 172.66 / WB 5094) TaxID=690307 RepID=A0A1L9WPW7_ASPA1|nr:uncharacterized protein ASPACDRAFT_44693 [Aspergillus aculeatus ATCC 16872]OJJ98188.1 hypothetical protein ASPACDRAFT_44693 [Aspergillus aculeatus ATCC 16872]
MAPGEADLEILLSRLEPILHPDTFVFVTVLNTPVSAASQDVQALQPQLLFQEAEGTTLVLVREKAIAHGFTDYVFPCRMISLSVHSSLEAVGLIAAISARLRDAGVSANVVSGFYHDHVFVPEGKEEVAMQVIGGMSRGDRD